MPSLRALSSFALGLFLVACAPSPASEVAPDPFAPDVSEEELRRAPAYTLTTAAIVGEYTGDEGCPGGFDACYGIRLTRRGGGLEVSFGEWNHPRPVRAWQGKGVVLFSATDDGDCDDPGCGNLRSVSGVIYPVRVGDAWEPRAKLTVKAEFPYPESDEDPVGDVTTVVRLRKKN